MSAKQRRQRQRKRNGFIVKGVTQRHWWDRWDKDGVNNSRQLVKRDLKHHMKAWGME
jgi:hypothetical protein